MIYINDNVGTSTIYLPNVNIKEYVTVGKMENDIKELEQYLMTKLENKTNKNGSR